jgi:hypothetical protein
MQPLYRGISYVFYPGSMAVLGLGFTHFKDPVSAWVWIIFISGMVILPLMALFLYMRLGRVSDIFIYQREQRHGLYVLGVIFSAVTSWLIFRENVLPVMVWSICNMSVLTLLFIINFAGYKVSAHMAGAAGLLGWIISLQSSGLPVFAAIVLTMLVYIARKGLSAHSHFELILGFCLGLFVTFALACLLLTYYGISCSFI